MRYQFSYSRRLFCVIAALSTCTTFQVSHAIDETIQAPNVVKISPFLVTSGQPSATSLERLALQNFSAVIYLAPTTVSDAVAGEAEIVRAQGLEFIHIPIPFGNPTQVDVEAFFEAMKRLEGKKVLVHCQVNMRASSMTFLYRSIIAREKPEFAYEAVSKVWSPSGPWKKLIVDQLKRAEITFEPF